ncbi:MAG: hypothetical protein ACJ790_01680 [Myxococcaceae bacterium]
MSSEPFELFNVLADAASAKVRRYVTDHELLAAVRFRNLTYEEVQADFKARGGTTPPALWDGKVLHTGAEACIARLDAYRDVGRAE